MVNKAILKAIKGFVTYLANRAGVQWVIDDGVLLVRSDGKRGKDLVVAIDFDEFKELLGGAKHEGIDAKDRHTLIRLDKK